MNGHADDLGQPPVAGEHLLILLGVKPVTRSERPRSVNDTAMSMSTGMMKKRTVRTIAGPRKIRKLVRCRPPAARASAALDDQLVPRLSPSLSARLGQPASSTAGPRDTGEGRRRRLSPRSRPTLFDDDVFRASTIASSMTKSAASCARQPSALDALDGLVDDAVQIAELRVVGQELGDLQQLGRPGQRPGRPCSADRRAVRA